MFNLVKCLSRRTVALMVVAGLMALSGLVSPTANASLLGDTVLGCVFEDSGSCAGGDNLFFGTQDGSGLVTSPAISTSTAEFIGIIPIVGQIPGFVDLSANFSSDSVILEAFLPTFASVGLLTWVFEDLDWIVPGTITGLTFQGGFFDLVVISSSFTADSITVVTNGIFESPVGQSYNVEVTILTNHDASDVPEPMTLAMFGLGLVGLGFMRRRRAA